MPSELYHALQTPVPFQPPNYPAPLQKLFDALHIDPPRFATPEKEDDITSTPPASPMEQINHLVLCAASDNTSDPDEQNEQVYTSDDDTRTHAPTQTTNENVYIP